MSGPGFDLFGDPIAPWCETRGRPRFRPTEHQCAAVRKMRAAGMAQPEIARRLGVGVPTLVRHFGRELGSRAVIARQYEE